MRCNEISHFITANHCTNYCLYIFTKQVTRFYGLRRHFLRQGVNQTWNEIRKRCIIKEHFIARIKEQTPPPKYVELSIHNNASLVFFSCRDKELHQTLCSSQHSIGLYHLSYRNNISRHTQIFSFVFH